ncbi:creatininase family protein [Halobaculum sp. MBLA0147]|uniref:creatininase family protein n=1 Tax=Halobaculum sp. MBLA0147 TaxID=3079934 RepID=UPI0035252CDC
MTRLHEQTTTAAAETLADCEVALLPTGAVEQHGPHLPLGTDLLAAREIARAVDAADTGVATTLLPTVPVGVSSHHRQFDGTLWTSPETFEAYVREVTESLARHGVRKVVAVNGHGGNDDALQRAARRVRREETAFLAPWNWFADLGDLDEELFDQTGIGHADAAETSIVYAAADRAHETTGVEESALTTAEANGPTEWGRAVHGAALGFDTADFSESGAVGQPTDASREKGERLFEHATDELTALVEWLADREFAALLPEPHR